MWGHLKEHVTEVSPPGLLKVSLPRLPAAVTMVNENKLSCVRENVM
jgi:hypothetical protein